MIIVPAIVVLIVALVLIFGGHGSRDAVALEAVDAMSAAVDERSTITLIRTPDYSISIRNV